MINLGQILKKNREDKNLNIRKLSILLGIDPALISKYEAGDRIPSEAHIQRFINAFNLPDNTLRKYWLAEKVIKLVKYEDIASEALLVAESRIKYLSKKVIATIDELSPEVNLRIKKLKELHQSWAKKKPLNKLQLHKMKEYFSTEYTYESNRIEGNTLTLKETDLVINQGLTIGGKSMQEHLEAVNHAEALVFITNIVSKNEGLTKRTLLELHALILKSVDKENAGKYRNVPVRITGSEHVPPQPYLLDELMDDFFNFYFTNRKILHPVILAAEMHERLVSIYPFIDGNGRTARLVMNLILLSNGYTIANLKGDLHSRMAYYNALEKVQLDNDTEGFHILILDTAIVSLERHIELA